MFHIDTIFEAKTVCVFKILANIFCLVFVSSGLHEIWIKTRHFPCRKIDLNMPLAKMAFILSRPQRVDICPSSSFGWPRMMCLHYLFLTHIVTLSNKIFKLCRAVIYSFEQLQTYRCNQRKIRFLSKNIIYLAMQYVFAKIERRNMFHLMRKATHF